MAINFLTLIPALIAIESGGDPEARGLAGEVGILQIRPIVVVDLNRLGYPCSLADRSNPDRARAMCRLYLEHYCTAQRLGREPTNADAARIWNGGPNGWQKEATITYWARVARAEWEFRRAVAAAGKPQKQKKGDAT